MVRINRNTKSLKKGECRMSKHTHVIVNAATNESITDQKVTTANFRDICRAYLTAPEHFGERLQVVRDRTADNAGEVIFDVTSIKYSSGKVRMTLFTEFERQQKLHEATAAKAAEREALMREKAKAPFAVLYRSCHISRSVVSFRLKYI